MDIELPHVGGLIAGEAKTIRVVDKLHPTRTHTEGEYVILGCWFDFVSIVSCGWSWAYALPAYFIWNQWVVILWCVYCIHSIIRKALFGSLMHRFTFWHIRPNISQELMLSSSLCSNDCISLDSCNCFWLVMQKLTVLLMAKLDSELKHEVIHWAAYYEHRLQAGSKAIFHLEAFIAKFMSVYKRFVISMFG